jgi:hypothetical protein
VHRGAGFLARLGCTDGQAFSGVWRSSASLIPGCRRRFLDGVRLDEVPFGVEAVLGDGQPVSRGLAAVPAGDPFEVARRYGVPEVLSHRTSPQLAKSRESAEARSNACPGGRIGEAAHLPQNEPRGHRQLYRVAECIPVTMQIDRYSRSTAQRWAITIVTHSHDSQSSFSPRAGLFQREGTSPPAHEVSGLPLFPYGPGCHRTAGLERADQQVQRPSRMLCSGRTASLAAAYFTAHSARFTAA